MTLLTLQGACERQSRNEPAPAPAAESAPEPARQPLDAPGATGRIEGTVRLASGAELPHRPDPLAGQPTLGQPPAPCSPLSEADLTPMHLGPERGLSNVHVALTRMKSVPEAAEREHEVRFEDCRSQPPMLGVRRGDTLRLVNRSQTAVLPALTGETFMSAILPGQERRAKVERTGVFVVTCAFGTYCGHTDVLATTHTLYAVTDERGHFAIDRVPFGQEVTVHAYHPLLPVVAAVATVTAERPVVELELELGAASGERATPAQ